MKERKRAWISLLMVDLALWSWSSRSDRPPVGIVWFVSIPTKYRHSPPQATNYRTDTVFEVLNLTEFRMSAINLRDPNSKTNIICSVYVQSRIHRVPMGILQAVTASQSNFTIWHGSSVTYTVSSTQLIVARWCSGCSGPKVGMRDDVLSNGVTCSCAEFKAVPSGKLWCPSPLAAEAVIGFGVIGPCLAREAIPQLAGLTELVLGDQGMSSVAWVRRVSRRPF